MDIKYIKNTIIMTLFTSKTIKPITMFNSLVHSLLVSINSSLYLLNYIDFNTIKKYYIFSITYFIIDYLIILKYFDLKNKIAFFFHHLISCYVLYIFVFVNKEDKKLNNLIAQCFTSEFPIIFLNINWFLIKYKKQNTKLFKICNHTMIITYFLFRICNFTYLLLYLLFMNFYKYKIFIGLLLIIYLLNCIWFVILFKRFKITNLKYSIDNSKKQ